MKRINEEVSDKILNSFEIKKTLNTKVWDDLVIKEDIRLKVLEIAEDFYDTLELTVPYHDIVLTGSLANYNWSEYSDIDVHIQIDFRDVNISETFLTSYFLTNIAMWNQKHNIDIYGFPVEMYVEDINPDKNTTISSGIYSLADNKWVVKPSFDKNTYNNKSAVKCKSEYLMFEIDELQRLFDYGEYDAVLKGVKYIKDKLSLLRKKTLLEDGEYSVDNLAFKVLRRENYIEKLNDLKVKAYDELNSIHNSQ